MYASPPQYSHAFVDLWPCDVGSVPILVFLGLSVLELFPMYATVRQSDVRQTLDVRQHHRLMPTPRGRGIGPNNEVTGFRLNQFEQYSCWMTRAEPTHKANVNVFYWSTAHCTVRSAHGLELTLFREWFSAYQKIWKKRSQRRKHCARAGCSEVRTPPALPPQTHKHTDRTDYNTLRR